ncbi:MAG: hypothetical protein M1826_005972 [Phylliscum demangeonii]|nr:MAG: hypothetical protein M1826_005972 [Phylliscum demangeonii]
MNVRGKGRQTEDHRHAALAVDVDDLESEHPPTRTQPVVAVAIASQPTDHIVSSVANAVAVEASDRDPASTAATSFILTTGLAPPVPSPNPHPPPPPPPATRAGRRRARSSSTELAVSPTPSSHPTRSTTTAPHTASEHDDAAGAPGAAAARRPDGRPSRKRPRLAPAMRLENHPPSARSVPTRPYSNGAASSAVLKGALARSTNGTSRARPPTNGSMPTRTHAATAATAAAPAAAAPTLPDYFGHDREEVARILIQSLEDLGYQTAADALSRESGYVVESPSATAFRHAILHGDWSEAERLLSEPSTDEIDRDPCSSAGDGPGDGLVLGDEADAKEMLFALRQQKYLELLEQRDLGTALMVLRQELTPLHRDVNRLHALSSLIMCQSAEDVRAQAGWDGAAGASRETLLFELSKSISPAVMIPARRLAVLLDQVKRQQIAQCLYHNTRQSPSLYTAHRCDRNRFPRESRIALDQHTDEVWYLAFSHDGARLAATGKDGMIVIYSVPNFVVLRSMLSPGDAIAFLTWSPDDSKILGCSNNRLGRVWDTETGACVIEIDRHQAEVSSGSWAPDGQTFVTGSLDRRVPLCLWNLQGECLHAWSDHYRIRDCSITPDGRRLVAITNEKKIYLYDMRTRKEEKCLTLPENLTCVSVSRDSRHMLVNLANNEIQLLDLETAEVVHRFVGQQQGQFVIRSSFGGATESFVISGSEDSRIYVWHKDTGALVETLEGHDGGCVNAIAWNPADPGMFASAGDDRRVRIWSRPESHPGRGHGSEL